MERGFRPVEVSHPLNDESEPVYEEPEVDEQENTEAFIIQQRILNLQPQELFQDEQNMEEDETNITLHRHLPALHILQRHIEMIDGIQSEHEIQIDNHKLRQELSRKGLSIVEKIMEEQKLSEGDYIEMCNIFKKLYS